MTNNDLTIRIGLFVGLDHFSSANKEQREGHFISCGIIIDENELYYYLMTWKSVIFDTKPSFQKLFSNKEQDLEFHAIVKKDIIGKKIIEINIQDLSE